MAQHILIDRRQRTTFQAFLNGMPARDYIFQKTPYGEQIRQAAYPLRIKDASVLQGGEVRLEPRIF